MVLTAIAVKSAKPKEKDYKLTDGRGLYLLIKKNGSKYWRQKYRIAGKEKLLALGVYPETSLAEAREQRDLARKKIAEGIDPCKARRVDKKQIATDTENSFSKVANEWCVFRRS